MNSAPLMLAVLGCILTGFPAAWRWYREVQVTVVKLSSPPRLQIVGTASRVRVVFEPLAPDTEAMAEQRARGVKS